MLGKLPSCFLATLMQHIDMRRFPFITGLLCLFTLSACAERAEPSLEKFKWKKRIILSYPSDSQKWAEQLKAMRSRHLEIKDRDLMILRLDTNLSSYDKAQREKLIENYKLTKGSHILIGKDGQVKDRQNGDLNLEKWFKLIDTMPMRQSEMKR